MIRADALDAGLARVPALARAAIAALILCGLILAMVVDRAMILRNGATVRLATEPVDPRDLFRGDYVILRYEISRLNLTRLGLPEAEQMQSGDMILVGLREGPNGKAQAARVVRPGAPRDAGLTWLQARVEHVANCSVRLDDPAAACAPTDRMVRVTYGLESYFVPQGEGRAIETTSASRVDIMASVSASGRAAIKALLIDGKPVYEEPPY